MQQKRSLNAAKEICHPERSEGALGTLQTDMSTSELTYDKLNAELLSKCPELRKGVQRAFGTDYELDKDSPGAYPIFEDVVLPTLLELLDNGNGQDVLACLFTLFEEMAVSNDGNVTDLLRIAILEPLVYRPESYQKALQYMGEKTEQFAALEEHTQKARNRSHLP